MYVITCPLLEMWLIICLLRGMLLFRYLYNPIRWMLEPPISKIRLRGVTNCWFPCVSSFFLKMHFVFKNKNKTQQPQMWLCSGKMTGSVIALSAQLPRAEMPFSWAF